MAHVTCCHRIDICEADINVPLELSCSLEMATLPMTAWIFSTFLQLWSFIYASVLLPAGLIDCIPALKGAYDPVDEIIPCIE